MPHSVLIGAQCRGDPREQQVTGCLAVAGQGTVVRCSRGAARRSRRAGRLARALLGFTAAGALTRTGSDRQLRIRRQIWRARQGYETNMSP
jgi:hypothetical protein